jgi:hypothetical protein
MWYDFSPQHSMEKFSSILFVLVLLACNNNSANTTEEKNDSEQASQAITISSTDFSGCYRKALQRDTVLLQLQQSGDSVSGTVSFDNYQKDSSSGTVRGSVKKDTVVLWYNFFSEGMHSVMEIVLQKTEDGLVRAVGPIVSKGDTALFKDHNEIKFDPRQTLQKIECNK